MSSRRVQRTDVWPNSRGKMRMKSMKTKGTSRTGAARLAWLGVPLAVLTAWVVPAAAQSGIDEINVPLSAPGQPVVLDVQLLNGSISVQGHEGNELVVDIEPEVSREKEERADGMKRIPNTGLGLTIEEESNVVEIRGDWSSRVRGIRIRVPRKTSMRLSTTNNGHISVDGVVGEHELNNTNGRIEATNVSGSVIAQTVNGHVIVTFDAIDADTPMSFVTLNGNVDVTFPAGTTADLVMNAGQGEIYTDFDVEVIPQELSVTERGEGGRYRLRVEREVRGSIGGGGPEMRFKTLHGNLYVRKRN